MTSITPIPSECKLEVFLGYEVLQSILSKFTNVIIQVKILSGFPLLKVKTQKNKLYMINLDAVLTPTMAKKEYGTWEKIK